MYDPTSPTTTTAVSANHTGLADRGRRILRLALLSAFAIPWFSTFAQGQESLPPPIVLENAKVRYVISQEGKNLEFIEKRSGRNLLPENLRGSQPVALAKRGGKTLVATACRKVDGQLEIDFGADGVTAQVGVDAKADYLAFELKMLSDDAFEEVRFPQVSVTCSDMHDGMSGTARDDTSAAALRVVNLKAQSVVGGRPTLLAGRAMKEQGFIGARVALLACAADELRPCLQSVVANEPMPESKLGGPFALGAEPNRGSYTFARVTEENVDRWIEMCKEAGIAQIHFHGWWRSLGHYEPHPSLFPNGLEGMKRAVAKIHEAGLKAGMHTLTGCISTNDPWVRPAPDPRLKADASFTLTERIDEKQTVIHTAEQPPEYDTVWTYRSSGNVVRIGEELVQFTGLLREPPYGFTGCRRGAMGTRPAAHAKGAKADHLYTRYASFLPDEDSTLLDEVADRIAGVFNTCKFDMIYMDGAEGMGDWYAVAKMRRAIFERLERPALVEASSWGNPSWVFHSRIGAWDYPNWGLKEFIDLHCEANQRYRQRTLLPAQLGWWAIFGPSSHHDAQLHDVVEYLCCKAMAYDFPLSFQALGVDGNPQNARQPEYLELIGRYERLRLANHFSPELLEKLAEPGADYHLQQASDGQWQFVPADYHEHKVTGQDNGTASWTIENRFGEQPLRVRIKALYSVEPYDSAGAIGLADFNSTDEFGERSAAPKVEASLESSTDIVKTGSASGRLTATNSSDSPFGAWARAGKRFAEEVDLSKHPAMGVWVHGDGGGHVLNLQPGNAPHYSRGRAEHYVHVDFTGWRYFELLLRERDAAEHGNYRWPYPGHYAVYRSPLDRRHVDRLNLFFNALPPGKEVTCYVSPIKALPTRKVELSAFRLKVGDKQLMLPATLTSGGWLEWVAGGPCKVYDPHGALIDTIAASGETQSLPGGKVAVQFACDGPNDVSRRAEVTVISVGPPLADDK